MRSILAKYVVVTPLVLGGANHAAEFRLASYVNMVRWWWRFRALPAYGNDRKIATFWEFMLFGHASKPFGRKRVSFRLSGLKEGEAPKDWNPEDIRRNDDQRRQGGESPLAKKDHSGIAYLTAQGFGNRDAFPCCSFGVEARVGRFDVGGVRVYLDKGKPSDDLREVATCALSDDDGAKGWTTACKALRDAMALIGLLGGFGARSRRGFGAVAVEKLIVDGNADDPVIPGLPADVGAYKKQIDDRLGSTPTPGIAPYSAHSDNFRYDICASHENARTLLNDIGWAFQIYRSWGQKPSGRQRRMLSISAACDHVHIKDWNNNTGSVTQAGTNKAAWYKAKFQEDHNDFKGSGFPDTAFDNRAIFGLPHNYGNTPVGWDNPSDRKNIPRRRASPLLFHFHRLAGDTGHTVFVASCVDSEFLPAAARLRVRNTLRTGQDFSAGSGGNIDWDLVKDFAEFVRGNGGAPRSSKGGPEHTDYTPLPVSGP